MKRLENLIDRLAETHSLAIDEYEELVSGYAGFAGHDDHVGHAGKAGQNDEIAAYAAALALKARRKHYGNDVYIRGLIEIGNICRNDCYYCGIRRSNSACERYSLTKEQILASCAEGYDIGFRTFVMQGGEGAVSVDTICEIVSEIRAAYPDCAITLSLGEHSREDYAEMYKAGADRYLLRHETADKVHYEKLHPASMSFDNRMRCLKDLKEIGFQTGCGFMVGSPYQTARSIAMDLKFIEEFQPDMCGIGPFIPQHDTPFRDMKPGTAEHTIFLLSIIRLIKPNILLPATTALGTISENGRERGMLAGANVVMPNLSPYEERSKYALYDNKLSSGKESAQNLEALRESMKAIGFEIVTSRGDIIK